MKTHISRINIKKGSKSVETACAARASEGQILTQILRQLRKELTKISQKQKSQPYVIKHISEGASSLSVEEKWGPRINMEVASRGGFIINLINIGESIRILEEEEFKKREEIIMSILTARGAPPAIVTTNCYRSGESVIFDNNLFDERYLLMSYIIDRCSIGTPIRDDLSNLLQPETIHAVSTPVAAWDFQDFMKMHIDNVSFMFIGDLGTGRPAPLLLDVKNRDRIDGIVLIGYSEDYVRNMMLAFEEEWPGKLIVAYALAPIKEETSRFRIMPKIRAEDLPRGWVRESLLLFFTAPITPNEVKIALEAARRQK
ncbi:MAG: hypothetical protein QXR45_14815 [Candidatus Bathyarchaeia archaeon]